MMGSTSAHAGAILTLGLLLTVGDAARADDPIAEQQPTLRRSVEILAQLDRPEVETPRPGRSWFVSNIHIKKKRGLEYTQVMSVNGHPMLFSVQGPVMRKKRLGLTLELRF